MLFNWLRNRRRRQILSVPFPADWERFLARVRHVRQLSDEHQTRLKRLVQIFVAEKHWEGCRGLVVTDELKVVIAAQACLLIVAQPDQGCFDHVLSVLVYPTGYVAKNSQTIRPGIAIEGKEARLGEAWWRGPVVLSWKDARAGARLDTPGHNLVLHEFAHQLDMMSGHTLDGTPPLRSQAELNRWAAVMEAGYQRLIADCQQGYSECIDCYGATDRAEFFAVVTEAFFETGRLLERCHADLYALLKDYYGLDPARWGGKFNRRPFV